MLRLTIDHGNSFLKTALFEDGLMQHFARVPHSDAQSHLTNLFSQNPSVSTAIFCSVSANDESIISQIREYIPLVLMNPSLCLPFKSAYKSPASLGLDRIANVAGALSKTKEKNILVVDCGTATTYSLISEGLFLGGAISPGINMRLQALSHFTARLPLVEPGVLFPALVGNNTEASIRAGTERAAVKELDAMINDYCSQMDELTVLLTGGAMSFFEAHLKSPIFAAPYLTLEGLHEILLLNEN